jgi:hypothetical protein
MDEFNERLADGTDVVVKCALIETANARNIEVGTRRVSEVYACVNNKVYFQDSRNDWIEATFADVVLVNDRAKYTLAMGPGSSLRIMEPIGGNFIQIDTAFASERLGSIAREAQATDVKYNTLNIGKREFDVLTPFGTVIHTPEDNADNDEVVFSIPSDRVEATLSVYSK